MPYIEELIEALKCTIITNNSDCDLMYDEGILNIVSFLLEVKAERRGLFICGNGGSAGIAAHMTADFLKNGGFNVRSLLNPSTITCLGNDLSYEYIFSKQMELMAVPGDVLISISSSGESNNIVEATKTIKKIGGDVITFTGFNPNNRLRKLGVFNVYVPNYQYGIVESIHNLILQQLVDMIVERDSIALKI